MLDAILDILGQSTWSGCVRQERAKMTGHYAEQQLASLLHLLEIPLCPKSKTANPVSRDAQFRGISYDLAIPSSRSPLICIKAATHTSNIGQYGESRDAL